MPLSSQTPQRTWPSRNRSLAVFSSLTKLRAATSPCKTPTECIWVRTSLGPHASLSSIGPSSIFLLHNATPEYSVAMNQANPPATQPKYTSFGTYSPWSVRRRAYASTSRSHSANFSSKDASPSLDDEPARSAELRCKTLHARSMPRIVLR
jgi:hypothetical protein